MNFDELIGYYKEGVFNWKVTLHNNPAAVAENAKAVGIIRRTNAECSCT